MGLLPEFWSRVFKLLFSFFKGQPEKLDLGLQNAVSNHLKVISESVIVASMVEVSDCSCIYNLHVSQCLKEVSKKCHYHIYPFIETLYCLVLKLITLQVQY